MQNSFVPCMDIQNFKNSWGSRATRVHFGPGRWVPCLWVACEFEISRKGDMTDVDSKLWEEKSPFAGSIGIYGTWISKETGLSRVVESWFGRDYILMSIPSISSNFASSSSISCNCYVKFPFLKFWPAKPGGKSSKILESLFKMGLVIMGSEDLVVNFCV